MDRLLFSFITGVFSSLLWPSLLPTWCLPILLITSLVCLQKRWLIACGTFAGVLWMSSVGYWLVVTQPDESLFSHRVLVTGQILTVVTGLDDGKFDFAIEKVSVGNKLNWQPKSHKIRLSWRKPDFALAQGQILQLKVKLKPRWGLANEAGFDYQKWQLSKNVVATGYVVNSENNMVLDNSKTFRQTLAEEISGIAVAESRWLLALGLGYRSGLQPSDWQMLQATGTSHLVAISGMHLGMVAIWSYLFFIVMLTSLRGISQIVLSGMNFSDVITQGERFPQNIRCVALSLTLLPCFCYALLAGFSIPTLRAFVMLVLAWSLVKFNINWQFNRFILVSLTCFLVIFPLSIFSISFWLSFSAILMIAFIIWRFPFQNKSHKSGSNNIKDSLKYKLAYFVVLQLGVTLLMIPLVVVVFGGASLVSPLVNMIAVPLVTLVLLPLSMLAIVLISLDSLLAYDALNLLLRLFLEVEQWLIQIGSIPHAWIDFGIADTLPLVLAALACLLLLMPNTLVPKYCFVILGFPLVSRYQLLQQQHWQLDVLDVGQGLSVLLRKQGHAIVYDTGAAYESGFSMANAVVLPILKKSNITYLDKLIISHDDNDHAGGMDIIRDTFPVADFLNSPESCHDGIDFVWRGLQFDVLWPDLEYVEQLQSDNNLSCVIKISDGRYNVLLAGDIEYPVERLLVDRHRKQQIDLSSDFLVVPHHGSKTSSTASFIKAVSPQYSLVSAGFRNRWRMPAQEVVVRYESAGVKVMNTAEVGQISLKFASDSHPEVLSWRINQHSRWYLSPWQE